MKVSSEICDPVTTTHHAVYRGCFHLLVFMLDYLNLGDGNNRLSETSVNKFEPKVHKNPGEQRSQLRKCREYFRFVDNT